MSTLVEAMAHPFWSRVSVGGNDDCWEWSGYRSHTGYGMLAYEGKTSRAHRVAWSIGNGRDIPDGLFVCHSCDNPPCCNPAHLWLGTAAENNRDKTQKGRNVRPVRDEAKVRRSRGESSCNAKLTEALVRQIRERRSTGAALDELASEYGVHRSLIWLIEKRKTWAHI